MKVIVGSVPPAYTGSMRSPMPIQSRRDFLRVSIVLAGLGLLTGCELPSLPWRQPSRVHRIGYLRSGAPNPTTEALFAAFRQGLHDLGYVEGQDLLVEVRRVTVTDQFA